MMKMKWCLLASLILVIACPDADARRRRKRRKKPGKISAAAKIKRQAKKHFRAGQRLFKRHKYAAAIVQFNKAYALRKHPAILYNIAMGHAYQNHVIKAATYIRRYLAEAKDKARTLPSVLQMILYQTGVLVINTPDPSAEIFVDGLPVGKGKVKLVVKVGKRTVGIRLGERIAARKTIRIKPREERVWDLKEIPREAPRPPPLRVRPRVDPRLPAERPRTVASTEPLQPRDTTWGKKKVHLAWFASMAALAVAAVGGGVAIDQTLTVKTFKQYEASGNTDRALYDKVILYRNITIGLYGLAGAAGITAIVLAFYTRWKKTERPKSAIRLTPAVGPGSVGFSFQWTH